MCADLYAYIFIFNIRVWFGNLSQESVVHELIYGYNKPDKEKNKREREREHKCAQTNTTI